jgi:hypothetical protein
MGRAGNIIFSSLGGTVKENLPKLGFFAEIFYMLFTVRISQTEAGMGVAGVGGHGEIIEGGIEEGGCEYTFLCLSLNYQTCRSTVPPAVALLNYISSSLFWQIFSQTGIFAGFSLHIITLAVIQ